MESDQKKRAQGSKLAKKDAKSPDSSSGRLALLRSIYLFIQYSIINPIVPIGRDNGKIEWKNKEFNRILPAIDKVFVM
jgi:hypothetical protein